MSLGITKECFPPASKCGNCQRKSREDIIEKNEERKDFERCSGCHLLTYCDKQCQAEHWDKVHKRHCKFLSGRKLVENSGHRKDNCPSCIDLKQTSVNEVINIESPKTDCHIVEVIHSMKAMLGKFFQFHDEGKTCKCSLDYACELPFPLGEVSGQYVNVGLEGMVAHALKIVNAVVIKDKQDTGRKDTLIQLWHHLIASRSKLWRNVLVYGVSKDMDAKLIKEVLIDPVKSLKVHYGPRHVWWKALMKTVDTIQNLNLEQGSQLIDPSSIEDPLFRNYKLLHDYDQLQLSNQVYVSQNNLWPRFKLWPRLFHDKLAIVLPDKTYCQTCNAPWTGEFDIQGDESDRSLPILMSKVGEKGELAVCCSVIKNPRCFKDFSSKDVRISFQMEQDKWKKWTEETKIFFKRGRVCDMCLKVSLFSHRCSECYASQYCSTLTQCQLEDLKFHKTVCTKWSTDKSKKIIGGKQQKKINKSKVDEYFTF